VNREIIQTRSVDYSRLEEGLFVCKLREGAELDVAEVEENIRVTEIITEGKRYAILTDARAHVTITKEGLDRGAHPDLQIKLIAQAILVTSLANRLVGNFIIKFHKPSSPTKLFSDYDAALTWLREKIAEERYGKKESSRIKKATKASLNKKAFF
jgi:hypothetical protein